MKIPSVRSLFRKITQLWRNREVIPHLYTIACNAQLHKSTIRVTRRLADRGHSKSALGLPVDGDGKPVPWYTYPLLDYLDTLDTDGWTVVEFGAGHSTLYWARRAEKVISHETEADWLVKIKPTLPANVRLVLTHATQEIETSLHEIEETPELVVIDGLHRKVCAEKAFAKFGRMPLYILDNSDWYLKAAEVFNQAGVIEIKFNGFGPANNYAWCSSLYFTSDSIRHLQRVKLRAMVPCGLPAGNTEELQDGIL